MQITGKYRLEVQALRLTYLLRERQHEYDKSYINMATCCANGHSSQAALKQKIRL
jgi:hypothetical protein